MGAFKAKIETPIDTDMCNEHENLFQGLDAVQTKKKLKKKREMINKTCHRNHSGQLSAKKCQSIKEVYIKVSISIIHIHCWPPSTLHIHTTKIVYKMHEIPIDCY
jgi:hypothetical protein